MSTVLDASKTSRIVKRSEFVEILKEKRGASMVTIVSHTSPTKKAFAGQVVKQSSVNGVINWSYEKSVNRQLAREGKEETFVAQPHKWGNKIPNTCIIEHKQNFYIELKVERSLKAEYFETRPDGSLVATTKEAVKDMLLKSSSNSQQGTTKAIILRDYKLANIILVKMDKIVYHLID